MTALEKLPERIDALTLEISQFRNEVRDEFSAVREDLRQEIRSGDQETRRFMRVLFEDYIDRLRVIDEGKGPNT